jgi:hypothetical protein
VFFRNSTPAIGKGVYIQIMNKNKRRGIQQHNLSFVRESELNIAAKYVVQIGMSHSWISRSEWTTRSPCQWADRSKNEWSSDSWTIYRTVRHVNYVAHTSLPAHDSHKKNIKNGRKESPRLASPPWVAQASRIESHENRGNRALARPSNETRERNASFERLPVKDSYLNDLDGASDSELVGPITKPRIDKIFQTFVETVELFAQCSSLIGQ